MQVCGSASLLMPDPDPAVHFNADPDPAFRFKKMRTLLLVKVMDHWSIGFILNLQAFIVNIHGPIHDAILSL